MKKNVVTLSLLILLISGLAISSALPTGKKIINEEKTFSKKQESQPPTTSKSTNGTNTTNSTGTFSFALDNLGAVFTGTYHTNNNTLDGVVLFTGNPLLAWKGVGTYYPSIPGIGGLNLHFKDLNNPDQGIHWNGYYNNGRWTIGTYYQSTNYTLSGTVISAPQ